MKTKRANILRTERDLDRLRLNKKGVWLGYKLTDQEGRSKRSSHHPDHWGEFLEYKVGKVVRAPNLDERVQQSCGAGVNVGTFRWLKQTRGHSFSRSEPTRMFLVEFDASKAVIPTNAVGKLRVRKVRVIAEVDKTTGLPFKTK